jgi:hypothetical protein
VTDQVESERILWQAYPSWGQFSWLYFFSLWTASRGLIFLYAELPGWEIWVVGAGLLLGVTVGLRHWAKYLITSRQVIIRNGYSGKTIIGTLVIQCHDSNRTLRFRGVKDPEIVETKLRALLPASSPVFTQVP